MSAVSICRQCGAAMKGAAHGLCPRCLVELGVALNIPNAPPPADMGFPAAAGSSAASGTTGDGQRRANDAGEPTTPEASARQFGDYELLEEIGRGGMGVVYRARQRSLDRVVAVKMIVFGPDASPELVKRFRAEAVSAASLHHANIVAIHEVGIHEDRHFFVMDYVQGQSLARLVGNQPLPAKRAAAYLQTIAEAVRYANERGILHRDLKPSNVLIDAQDQPHVVDFGLARRLEGDSELTVTGQVLGSPHYLPPEQAAGQRARVSRRADVYALGATLYHLLTGRPPFQAESLAQTLDLVLHADPVAPRLLNRGVPADLETICLKCLEKEPARRYPTAQELADELARWDFRQGMKADELIPRTGLVDVHRGLEWVVTPDNRSLITTETDETGQANLDRQISRWDFLSGTDLQHFPGHREPIMALAISPDGRLLATAAAWTETAIKLWEIPSFWALGELAGHRKWVGALKFSPDGHTLVSGSADETIRLWDVATWQELITLGRPGVVLEQVAFSADGNRLLARTSHGDVLCWLVPSFGEIAAKEQSDLPP